MSNIGFVQIQRAFFHDKLWLAQSPEFRNFFLTILINCAWDETTQDDWGIPTVVLRGQFLTTERELVSLCYPPTSDAKKLAKYKSACSRFLKKSKSLGFSYHKTNHKKTIISITRDDILRSIEPNIEPKTNQTRTKLEPQKKKSKKQRSKENTPKPPKGDEPLSRGGVSLIFDCLKQIDPKYMSEYQKEKLTQDFPDSEHQMENALRYANSLDEIKTSLYGVVKWYCEQEIPPETPLSEEESFDINKKFAFSIDDLKNDIAKFEKCYRYCEIIFFANCPPLVFNYDENPKKFTESLCSSLRTYRLAEIN